MVGKTEAVACAHLGDGYSLWLFRLSSYGKAASPLEDADARSPRPRACDFRRLRFARNASFRRSFLESLLESLTGSFFGSVAGAPLCPSRLRFSSFIVDLFSCAERMTERIDAALELSANIGKWQLRRRPVEGGSGDWCAFDGIIAGSRLRQWGPCGKDRRAL
jgi:hypothetical protein